MMPQQIRPKQTIRHVRRVLPSRAPPRVPRGDVLRRRITSFMQPRVRINRRARVRVAFDVRAHAPRFDDCGKSFDPHRPSRRRDGVCRARATGCRCDGVRIGCESDTLVAWNTPNRPIMIGQYPQTKGRSRNTPHRTPRRVRGR